jgi:hypothetical protein
MGKDYPWAGLASVKHATKRRICATAADYAVLQHFSPRAKPGQGVKSAQFGDAAHRFRAAEYVISI